MVKHCLFFMFTFSPSLIRKNFTRRKSTLGIQWLHIWNNIIARHSSYERLLIISVLDSVALDWYVVYWYIGTILGPKHMIDKT